MFCPKCGRIMTMHGKTCIENNEDKENEDKQINCQKPRKPKQGYIAYFQSIKNRENRYPNLFIYAVECVEQTSKRISALVPKGTKSLYGIYSDSDIDEKGKLKLKLSKGSLYYTIEKWVVKRNLVLPICDIIYLPDEELFVSGKDLETKLKEVWHLSENDSEQVLRFIRSLYQSTIKNRKIT